MFIMMQVHFCERFALGEVEPHENPIEFWTDPRIKKVVDLEQKSYKGILHMGHCNIEIILDPVFVKKWSSM